MTHSQLPTPQSMPLQHITNQRDWDEFISSQPLSQFTQSWTWGEFRIARGQEIKRLALVDAKGEMEASALFTYIKKPLVGGYWYAPRGPVIRDGADASDTLKRFLSALAQHPLLHPLPRLPARLRPPPRPYPIPRRSVKTDARKNALQHSRCRAPWRDCARGAGERGD